MDAPYLAEEHHYLGVDVATAHSNAMEAPTPPAPGGLEPLLLRYGTTSSNELLVSRRLLPYAFFPLEGARRSIVDVAMRKATHARNVGTERFYSTVGLPKPQGLEALVSSELRMVKAYSVAIRGADTLAPASKGPSLAMMPEAPSFEDELGRNLQLWVCIIVHPRCDAMLAPTVEWAFTPALSYRATVKPELAAAWAVYARRVARTLLDTLLTTAWEILRGVAAPFLAGDPFVFDSIMDTPDMTSLQLPYALDREVFPQACRSHTKYVGNPQGRRFWAAAYNEMARAGTWDSLTPYDEGAAGGVVPEERVWTLRKAEWTGLLPPELYFPGPRPERWVGPLQPEWQRQVAASGVPVMGYLYLQTHRMEGDDQRDTTHDPDDELRSGLASLVRVPVVVEIMPRAWPDVHTWGKAGAELKRQSCALVLHFVDPRLHLRTLPNPGPGGDDAIRAALHDRQRARVLGLHSDPAFGRVQAALGSGYLRRLAGDLTTKVLAPMAWRVERVEEVKAQSADAIKLAMILDGDDRNRRATGVEEEDDPTDKDVPLMRAGLEVVLAWMAPTRRPMAAPERLRAQYTVEVRPRVHSVLGGLQAVMPATRELAHGVRVANSPFREYYKPASQ